MVLVAASLIAAGSDSIAALPPPPPPRWGAGLAARCEHAARRANTSCSHIVHGRPGVPNCTENFIEQVPDSGRFMRGTEHEAAMRALKESATRLSAGGQASGSAAPCAGKEEAAARKTVTFRMDIDDSDVYYV